MSMFTPVGMDGRLPGSYRRPRRRRWPAVVLVLVLAGAGASGYWFLLRDEQPTKVATVSCPKVTPTPVALLAPAKVTVHVYNATQRFGLARAVAKTMGGRGYAVGKVDNDPLKRNVAGVAEIRHGRTGLRQAQTVQALVPDAVLVVDARRTGDVDLVLGQKWRRVAAEPVAPLETPDPRPGCGPTPRGSEPASQRAGSAS